MSSTSIVLVELRSTSCTLHDADGKVRQVEKNNDVCAAEMSMSRCRVKADRPDQYHSET